MMKHSLTLLTLAVGTCLATASVAAQRIRLSAALAQCKTQGGFYQGNIMDGGTDSSISPRASQRCRACVYSKSGQYLPQTHKGGITISGSACIGIVVSD
jgi:hypothetical protein